MIRIHVLGTLQGSGINEEFLRHLEDGTCVHQPASHDSTLPPEGTEVYACSNIPKKTYFEGTELIHRTKQ